MKTLWPYSTFAPWNPLALLYIWLKPFSSLIICTLAPVIRMMWASSPQPMHSFLTYILHQPAQRHKDTSKKVHTRKLSHTHKHTHTNHVHFSLSCRPLCFLKPSSAPSNPTYPPKENAPRGVTSPAGLGTASRHPEGSLFVCQPAPYWES